MSKDGRQKALESTLASLNKRYGDGVVMKLGEATRLNIESIPTGSLSLDIALGVGGIPKGRIIEVYGPESSGKTTLCLHVVAEAQKVGGYCGFVDVEHALDPAYARKIGVDVDANDRMLVGVRKLGQVLIFNNASTLDGAAEPDVALSIASPDVKPMPAFATMDSEDRLYIADSNGNVVFSFDRASELTSGEHFPSRTIDSSDLIAPNRLLLYER